MATSFADALSPLAKTMSRAARNIEIMRVSAQLSGEEFAKSADVARAAVLKWASKRAGSTLPKEAWDHRDFDLMSGGRNSAAIRIATDAMDLWALRAEDPDKTVAGRIWSTEVVIGGEAGKRPHLSLRLIVSTTEANFLVEPHVPGTVLQMIQSPGLIRGARPILAAPRLIQSDNDAHDLCDHLEDPDRRLPVFVISLLQGENPRPLIDDVSVAKATAGLARVVRIPDAQSWILTERFGKYRAVFNAGVRAYMPGFSATDDPYNHRLFLGENLRDSAAAAACAAMLRTVAAETSITSTRLGKEVLDFSSIRTASRRLRAEDQTSRSAPDAEVLETAQLLVESLEKQVVEKEIEIDGYIEMSEAAEARALTAEQENRALLFKVRQLKDALAKGGETPTLEPPSPLEWGDFLDWLDQTYPDRVLLTPAARRMAKNPEYENVELVARAITWLATDQHDIRVNGGGSLREVEVESGIRNAACGGDTYQTDWKGRRYDVDWHIKNGGNVRDPKRCLRIYYFWEQETQQTIIDYLPAHRKTGMT
ncbi:hypothetical protein [Marinobacter segnicrescens]|uniref:hypothetical protein n=1 Tax=Marinobacter segnicrescens TaxID=430453 RepID=UPI003A956C9B